MGYVSRLSDEVGPEHVGRRATLRLRLPGGRFRDIVGVLEWWRDGAIGVRRRGGDLVEVAAADIAASRLVPQEPPARRPRQA
ncbi:putative acetyltransferase [Nocardiopsis coralliicola]